MAKTKKEKQEPVLHIFSNRSVLVTEDGVEYPYNEGKPSEEAKQRLAIIKETLENGFLEKVIAESKDPSVKIEKISPEQTLIIESLVNSVTSEVGRAIVGLTILQLTIKSILPEQSIRLHKGSSGADFSWKEGVPMRVLDKNYITPILRKHQLLRLNADGFMMTRSLAENYPYSKLYKAAIRGARQEWLEIMDAVELGNMDIIESWDAKYGKTYLRDELEELNDKLKTQPLAKIVGFITDQKPNLKPEITSRIEELELMHDTKIEIKTFGEWVNFQIQKYGIKPDMMGIAWLTAICDSICQVKRDIAPIDEPTTEWVESFRICLLNS